MGIIDKAIPQYVLKNNKLSVEPVGKPEPVYIDDMFDPLFNRDAKDYLAAKYGNPVLGTLGGYAEGIDNALLGQDDKWGIFGPGMGVLSNFGRTMDKAADPIIGGLTEGINALSGLGDNRIQEQNPLKQIFVEDEDYTGKKLFAAIGNSMSKLAGAPLLDESDFGGAWNIPALGTELALDPGIIGAGLRAGTTPAFKKLGTADVLMNMGDNGVSRSAKIGQLLSNYDDFMAKASLNAIFPGSTAALKNLVHKIDQTIGGARGNNTVDVAKDFKVEPDTSTYTDSARRDLTPNPKPTKSSPPTAAEVELKQAEQMYESISNNPELMSQLSKEERNIINSYLHSALGRENPELAQHMAGLDTNLYEVKSTLDYVKSMTKNRDDEQIANIAKQPKHIQTSYSEALSKNTKKQLGSNQDRKQVFENAKIALDKNYKLDAQGNPMYYHQPGTDGIRIPTDTPVDTKIAYYETLDNPTTAQIKEYDFMVNNRDAIALMEAFDNHLLDVEEPIFRQLEFDLYGTQGVQNYPKASITKSSRGLEDTAQRLIEDVHSAVESGFNATNITTDELKETLIELTNTYYKDWDTPVIHKFIDNGVGRGVDVTLDNISTIARPQQTIHPALEHAEYIPGSYSTTGHYIPEKLRPSKGATLHRNVGTHGRLTSKRRAYDEYATISKQMDSTIKKYTNRGRNSVQTPQKEWDAYDKALSSLKFEKTPEVDTRVLKITPPTSENAAIQNYIDAASSGDISKFDRFRDPVPVATTPDFEGMDFNSFIDDFYSDNVWRKTGGDVGLVVKQKKGRTDIITNAIDRVLTHKGRTKINKFDNPNMEYLRQVRTLNDLLNNLARTGAMAKNPELYHLQQVLNASVEAIDEISQQGRRGLKAMGDTGEGLRDAVSNGFFLKEDNLTLNLENYLSTRNAYTHMDVDIEKYASSYLPPDTKDILTTGVKRENIAPMLTRLRNNYGKKSWLAFQDPTLLELAPAGSPERNFMSYLINTKSVKGEFVNLSRDEFIKRTDMVLSGKLPIDGINKLAPREWVSKEMNRLPESLTKEAVNKTNNIVPKVPTLRDPRELIRADRSLDIDGLRKNIGLINVSKVLDNNAALRNTWVSYDDLPNLYKISPQRVEDISSDLWDMFDEYKYLVDSKSDLVFNPNASDGLIKFTEFQRLNTYYKQAPTNEKNFIELFTGKYTAHEGKTEHQIFDMLENFDMDGYLTLEKLENQFIDLFPREVNSYSPPKTMTELGAKMESDIVTKAIDSTVDEVIQNASNVTSSMESKAMEAIENGLGGNPNPKVPLEEGIKTYGSKDQWTLFKHIKKAMNTILSNKSTNVLNKSTMQNTTVKKIFNNLEEVANSYGWEKRTEFIRMRDMLTSDITLGKNMISDLIASNGMSITLLDKTKDSKLITELHDTITANIKQINDVIDPTGKTEAIKLVMFNEGNNVKIGYHFNTDNTKLAKAFKKNAKKLDALSLKDITFHQGVDLATDTEFATRYAEFADLSKLMDEAEETSQSFSKMIGIDNPLENYTRHVLSPNEIGAKYLDKTLYQGMSKNKLEQLSEAMLDSSSRTAFGSRQYTRSLRGPISRYNVGDMRIFSEDPMAITKATFTKGAFDNSKVQDFVGLVVNDDFKISNFASSKKDLQDILFAKDAYGNASGNLTNMLLVAPKFDKNGKIAGFTRFDKLTDAGLDSALANPNTVLMPTNAIAPLDRMLRIDNKMSNKAFATISKYLTTPFKFSVLYNPSFLLGNVSDAWLKQAVAISNKQGVSLGESIANTMSSIKYTIALENKVSDIADIYAQYLVNNKILGGGKVPRDATNMLLTNPKFRDEFRQFLSKPEGYLTPEQVEQAKLWLLISDTQNDTMFSKNFQDLGDILKTKETNPYEHRGVAERALYGKGEYEFTNLTTWGLVTNNPMSKAILGSSGAIEETFRKACMYNDLSYKYGMDNLTKIVNIADDTAEYTKMRVDLIDALNLSHEANFDYENVTNLMDAMSRAIPFPTFFLKNMGFWLNILNENPQMIDNLLQTQEGLWSSRDTDEDKFQAEAKGRGAIPIESGQKLSKFFKGIYKPSPLNSMFGAFNQLNDPAPNLAYRLHPGLAIPTHHLQEDENVKYRPYNTNMYQKNMVKGDEGFNWASYQAHRMNPYDRTLSSALRLPQKVEKGNTQLSDFLPSVFQPDFSKK